MSKDDKVTVLHNKQAPAKFVPEFEAAQVTGYAAMEDGMKVVLRLATADGHDLHLIVPTVQVEAMRGALSQAKMVAAAKTIVAEGETSVFRPQAWTVLSVNGFDGVLVQFDKGAPSEMTIGLDHASARSLGVGLQKTAREVAARPRLIVPTNELIR